MSVYRTTALPMLAALVLSGACVSTPEAADHLESAGRVISAEAIERTGATNGWDVLRAVGTHFSFRENARGKPTSLTYRGHSSVRLAPDPLLVVDGARVDHFEYLRDIPALSIESIRILDGAEGTRYFGTGAGNGAIVVATKVKD